MRQREEGHVHPIKGRTWHEGLEKLRTECQIERTSAAPILLPTRLAPDGLQSRQFPFHALSPPCVPVGRSFIRPKSPGSQRSAPACRANNHWLAVFAPLRGHRPTSRAHRRSYFFPG